MNLHYVLVNSAAVLMSTTSLYAETTRDSFLAPPGTAVSSPGSDAEQTPVPPTNIGPTPSSPSTGDSSYEGLTKIIVTAQRKSENLVSVPDSVTATSGSQLTAMGITEVAQLQFNTPGLLPVAGVGYTQIYIRGIGNNIVVGADPSVLTNIDDVPHIYASLVNNLVNVDRVEVLKGAQGGLYGRNATGGVVNIITRQPEDQNETYARVSYGTKNTLEAALYGNVKLNDMISWNVSFQRDSHDNYVKNLEGPDPLTAAMFPAGGGPVLGTLGVVTPAQTAAFFNSTINPQSGYGNQDFWAGDSKIKLQFTDDFKVTIAGDASTKHDSEGDQWYLTTPAFSQATDAGILGSFGVIADFPPGFFKYSGKFQNYNSTPAEDYLTDYGGSIKPQWKLPGVDVTNIFAYRAQQTYYSQNAAHPVTVDEPIADNSKWYLYEELRAISTFDGPFHILGGASYLKDHVDAAVRNLIFPPIGTVPIPEVAAATDTYTVSTDLVKNWSVYTQVGYDFTDALGLTVSGRYIHETNNAVFTSPVDSAASIVASKFLPSATLSYKVSGGGNIYARYAQGFKAGGVNPVVPPNFFPTDYGKVFGPEKVSTYEVGYRNSLLDQRVQVTTAIFYNDYSGLQTITIGNAAHLAIIEAIINAGTARTYGAEASVDWRLIRPLTLGADVAYLDAKYKSFANTDGSVINTFDFSGRGMIDSPRWQLGLTANLAVPLNDRLSLVGTWLTSYTSNVLSQYSTVPGIPDAYVPNYWLSNVRIGVKTADDRYRLSAFVNNVFDAGYLTFNALSSLGSDAIWGNPRIIGGEVAVKFH